MFLWLNDDCAMCNNVYQVTNHYHGHQLKCSPANFEIPLIQQQHNVKKCWGTAISKACCVKTLRTSELVNEYWSPIAFSNSRGHYYYIGSGTRRSRHTETLGLRSHLGQHTVHCSPMLLLMLLCTLDGRPLWKCTTAIAVSRLPPLNIVNYQYVG